jgi:hypothetical protein
MLPDDLLKSFYEGRRAIRYLGRERRKGLFLIERQDERRHESAHVDGAWEDCGDACERGCAEDLQWLSVQGDDGHAWRKLLQSLDRTGATKPGHVQPNHDEIKLTVSSAAQRVHRMMARRCLVPCGANCRHQVGGRRLIVITNHYTRHRS